MNVENAISEIAQDGYTIVRHLIDSERLSKLDRDAEALLINWDAACVDGGSVNGRMHKGTFAVSRAFDDIIIHPVLLSIVEAVLDPLRTGEHENELQTYINALPSWETGIKCNIMIKDAVPREDVRSLHRDVRIPVPRPHRPVVCNTLLAIDPFTIDNGATCVIPGSHRWISDDVPDDKPVPVEPGGVPGAGKIVKSNERPATVDAG
ncbi:MAG: phytanoyl-CoA dioxygenase family protein, partial [Pseudomonadota bacterium]